MKGAVRLSLWLVVVAALCVGGLAVAGGRFALEGEHAMRLSDREFNQGHLREALLFARRAAVMSAPGLRHVSESVARLDAIAVGAEAAGRQEIAVFAWQSIRSVESQRSPGRPAERLATANQRLAVLLGDDARRASIAESQRATHRLLRALELAPRSRGPVGFASLAMLLGLVLAYEGLGASGSRRSLLLGVGSSLTSFGAIGWAILISLL